MNKKKEQDERQYMKKSSVKNKEQKRGDSKSEGKIARIKRENG